ncbi:MAG: hypothetical protein WBF16_05680 [Candidatus Deferrimicrobiaceae bacterium]
MDGRSFWYNDKRVLRMYETEANRKSSGSRTTRILTVGFVILCVAFLLCAVWIKRNVYASKFTPVSLSQQEEEVLDSKLALLRDNDPVPAEKIPLPGKPLTPEAYTEEGAKREIQFTERELNALIANSPDTAEKVAVDLSDDLISVKLVLPVDEEVPVLGGKTLKIHMGLTVSYEESDPIIALKGVSLGGIPLPNAWLGDLKNVNLLEQFGTDDGFWKIFSAGVRTIRIRQGHLLIRLKE